VIYDPLLTAITVADNNQNYRSIDGVLFDKNAETLIKYPEGKTASSYTVPDGTIKISAYAFYNNEYLKGITIPASVTSFGNYAVGAGLLGTVSGFTISGYTGSAAETYATANGITFNKLEKTSVVYGDIYIDGTVSLKDLSYLAKYMVSLVTMTDAQKANADVYYDGSITIKDLSLLAKYIAQYPVKLGPQA
jgi:hypothetical protein